MTEKKNNQEKKNEFKKQETQEQQEQIQKQNVNTTENKEIENKEQETKGINKEDLQEQTVDVAELYANDLKQYLEMLIKDLEEKHKENKVTLRDFAEVLLVANLPEEPDRLDVDKGIINFTVCAYVDEKGNYHLALLDLLERVSELEGYKNLLPYVVRAKNAFGTIEENDKEVYAAEGLNILDSIQIEDKTLLTKFKKLLDYIKNRKIVVEDSKIKFSNDAFDKEISNLIKDLQEELANKCKKNFLYEKKEIQNARTVFGIVWGVTATMLIVIVLYNIANGYPMSLGVVLLVIALLLGLLMLRKATVTGYMLSSLLYIVLSTLLGVSLFFSFQLDRQVQNTLYKVANTQRTKITNLSNALNDCSNKIVKTESVLRLKEAQINSLQQQLIKYRSTVQTVKNNLQDALQAINTVDNPVITGQENQSLSGQNQILQPKGDERMKK